MITHPMQKRMPLLLFALLLGFLAVGLLFFIPQAGAKFQAFSCDQIPAAECAALEALYINTNGAEWLNNNGWLASSTPCSWYGITCNDSNSNVTQIILTGNNLAGTIPGQIGNLTELTWLDLGANNLEGGIPTEIGALIKLRTLYLAGNRLSGAIPYQLGNLSALELLYLNRNRFEGAVPPQLGNLDNLQFLYLDGSKFEGSVPAGLCDLDSLIATSLGYNKFSIAETDSCVNSLDAQWADSQTVPPSAVEAVIPQTAVVENYAIEISWEPIEYSTDTGYYEILMSTTSGGPYELRGRTLDKTISQHTVRNLAAGIPYYFVIRTVTNPNPKNQNELESVDSAEVTGTPSALSLTSFGVGPLIEPVFVLLLLGVLIITLIFITSVRRETIVEEEIS